MPKFSLRGVERMLKNLSTVHEKFADEAARALYQEAEIEATEVKRRVPVDTGNLRASVHVKPPERKGDTLTIVIACGGPAAPYALYVHENLEAFHKVGQAKFLESVIAESQPYIMKRVAARMKKNGALK